MHLPIHNERPIFVRALKVGLLGAIVFVCAFPFALFALPVVLMFWVCSTGYIALQKPRFVLVTAMIPNLVAAGLPLLILIVISRCSDGLVDRVYLSGAQYCLIVGVVVSLLISLPLSFTVECRR